mgnify:CR=1 FL=1
MVTLISRKYRYARSGHGRSTVVAYLLLIFFGTSAFTVSTRKSAAPR